MVVFPGFYCVYLYFNVVLMLHSFMEASMVSIDYITRFQFFFSVKLVDTHKKAAALVCDRNQEKG